MNIEFDITKPFSDDMGHLPLKEQAAGSDQINTISHSLLNGQKAFKENSFIPYIFNLKVA